jgi:pregnane X receptor
MARWWPDIPTSSLAAYRFLFLKIMAVLTELRSINAQQTQQLLRIQDSHPFATPLMQELFSSTDG